MENDTIRVLIADDEPGMRMILRKMIARVEGTSWWERPPTGPS